MHAFIFVFYLTFENIRNNLYSLCFSLDPYRFVFMELGPSWETCSDHEILRPTSNFSGTYCFSLQYSHFFFPLQAFSLYIKWISYLNRAAKSVYTDHRGYYFVRVNCFSIDWSWKMENKHPQVFIKLSKINLICFIRTVGVAGLYFSECNPTIPLFQQSFKLVRKAWEKEIQKLPMWKTQSCCNFRIQYSVHVPTQHS